MQLPVTSRLAVEDFPDQKSWIGKLLSPFNSFLQNVSYALNGSLTFGQNIQGQEQLLDFTYNTNSLPLKFSISLTVKPLQLAIVQATENLSTPVALVCAWQVNNGQVWITDVTKLSNGTPSALKAGARYQLRVRITP